MDIDNEKHIYMVGRQTKQKVNNTSDKTSVVKIYFLLYLSVFNSSSDSRKPFCLRNPGESSGGISIRIQLLTVYKNTFFPYLMEPAEPILQLTFKSGFQTFAYKLSSLSFIR